MTSQEEKEFIIEDISRKAVMCLMLERVIREEMTISKDVMIDANKVYQEVMKAATSFRDECRGKNDVRLSKTGTFEVTSVDGSQIRGRYTLHYFGCQSYYDRAVKGKAVNLGSLYLPNSKSIKIVGAIVGDKILNFHLCDSIAHELTHRYEVGKIEQSGNNPVNGELYDNAVEVMNSAGSAYTDDQRAIATALYASYDKEINAYTHGFFASIQDYDYIRDTLDILNNTNLRAVKVLKKLDDALYIIKHSSQDERAEYHKIFGVATPKLMRIIRGARRKYLVKIGKECALHNIECQHKSPITPTFDWNPI